MKINSIMINSTNSITDLCKLGVKYPTDKSPYVINNTPNGSGHRHPYTSVYNILFSTLRYKKIKLSEIGILDNMSMTCWREYFTNADLFGFDYKQEYIDLSRKSNLDETIYDYINIKEELSLIHI